MSAKDRLIERTYPDWPAGLAPVRLVGRRVIYLCGHCSYLHRGVIHGYSITEDHGLVFTVGADIPPALWFLAEQAVPASDIVGVEAA